MDILKSDWYNPSSQARLKLVFKGRTLDFGAYELRSNYDYRLLKAFGLTCMGILIIAMSPMIMRMINNDQPTEKTSDREVVIDMTAIEPESRPLPPDKPVSRQQSDATKMASRQFSALIVRNDSADQMLSQHELSQLLLAAKTGEGSDSLGNHDTIPNVDIFNGEKTETIIWAEEMPEFPGGDKALRQYLSGNIRYPADARVNQISGTVYLSFVVDKEGEISGIKLLRGIGGGCEEEAMRVVGKMPRWSPGKQNGKAVQVQMNLPVNFILR